MIRLTADEIAELVGGRVDSGAAGVVVAGRAAADSRDVEPGGLFAAIRGERVDGHDYVDEAFDRGAALALVARAVGRPAVVVDDVVASLGALAHGVLGRLPSTRVVALTGSSGKTTTKDLLGHVLVALGPTVAPAGSYNTEVGLPLTVLRADHQTRALVLEMGARGVGHIAYLCRIARPDVAVVLNVGLAHVGEFGSPEAVARAKGEIVESLTPAGAAVLNADDERVRAMASRTTAHVTMFGRAADADVRARDVALDDEGRARFVLSTPTGDAPVALRVVGEHQVSNGLAVAAVSHTLGLDTATIAERLSSASVASRWRMEVDVRSDGLTVINDAYNANPESVRAALDALVAVARGRRTWAVLGEMRELGDRAAAEHVAVGRRAAELGIDQLVAVGVGARPLLDGAELEGSWRGAAHGVADVEEAIALLRDQVGGEDVVLVKASRAVGLETVAAALLSDPLSDPVSDPEVSDGPLEAGT